MHQAARTWLDGDAWGGELSRSPFLPDSGSPCVALSLSLSVSFSGLWLMRGGCWFAGGDAGIHQAARGWLDGDAWGGELSRPPLLSTLVLRVINNKKKNA